MKKKILLIEDHVDVRENTAQILSMANYHVFTAANGKEGVELANAELPDLVICDIMMPLLDGYGVLHLLSKNAQTAHIPFIFLTARADRNDFRKGMEMGADDYLTKPFDDIELLNAIESRLKKSQSLKNEFSRSNEGLNSFLESARNFEDLKKIAVENDLRTYRKKDPIYTEGNYPKYMFFLAKGKVKTFRTNEQGKELITALYNAGDFFGYTALLDSGTYNDTAAPIEDADIRIIPKDDFFALIYKNAEVSRAFIGMLTNQIEEKESQLLRLAYNSVRKRLAEALLTLYSRYNKKNEVVFSISISREDLAHLAGTATETTIRTLSDFKDEGLVELKGSTITIPDTDKLARIKN